MTVTADHPARTAANGDPCPSWCVTDHGKYNNFHAAKRIRVEAPQFYSWHISATRSALTHTETIDVAGPGMVQVAADEAGELAAIIEHLATATPDQHRELAAAIRQAAAQITEAGQ